MIAQAQSRPAAQAGWNLPSATIAGQHFFDAGRDESLCGTVFYAGVRVPQRDARHMGCPRCVQILVRRKTT